jgi:transposase
MENSVVYAGLDYHQDSVQVCVMDRQGKVLSNKSCVNDWLAIRRCVAGGGQVRAAIEACTGAADLAEELVSAAGWSVSLAHPGYVNRMKQRPDKTDLTDARLLADLERVGYLPRVWLAPEATRELRRLVRQRQQLVDRRRAIKLRVGALLRDHRLRAPAGINRWTKKWLQWVSGLLADRPHSGWIVQDNLEELEAVSRRIERCEDRLVEATREDAVVGRLRQTPGVGVITACVMRAEIGRFDRFSSGKQLAHFCGLSPRNASSGARQADAGLVDTCNRDLRSVLIEAAHRLIRLDARWGALARQMRARGKPGSLVAAAVANRWVRRLYHEMKQVVLPLAA